MPIINRRCLGNVGSGKDAQLIKEKVGLNMGINTAIRRKAPVDGPLHVDDKVQRWRDSLAFHARNIPADRNDKDIMFALSMAKACSTNRKSWVESRIRTLKAWDQVTVVRDTNRLRWAK
jgi:hypothetical protein